MKRVLFFATDNTISSGAFKSMAKLCELIKKDGRYEPTVLLPNKGDGYTLLEKNNIDYKYIRSCRWIIDNKNRHSAKTGLQTAVKKLINFFSYFKIKKYVNSGNFDIVHINTLHAYIGAVVAGKLNIPVVWHFRELLEDDQECWFWDDNSFELINSSKYCIAISEYVYDKFVKYTPEDKLIMIPNGIDETEYTINRTEWDDSKLKILCVGNMDGHKGQDIIIKACRILVEKNYTCFSVDFVGTGSEEERYKKECTEAGLDEYIKFNGKSNKVKEFYSNADVMVMGSKAEAFGRTTVEAMMAGCVIIGSDSGATPGLLCGGRYGYLFESGNHEQLAEKFIYLIENRNTMKEMALLGQKYALENYTAQKNASRVIDVYEKIR